MVQADVFPVILELHFIIPIFLMKCTGKLTCPQTLAAADGGFILKCAPHPQVPQAPCCSFGLPVRDAYFLTIVSRPGMLALCFWVSLLLHC